MRFCIDISPKDIQQYGDRYQWPVTAKAAKAALALLQAGIQHKITRLREELMGNLLDQARAQGSSGVADAKPDLYAGHYLDKPHKTRVENCKGVLAEPLENYGKWAYWWGKNKGGWHSMPEGASLSSRAKLPRGFALWSPKLQIMWLKAHQKAKKTFYGK